MTTRVLSVPRFLRGVDSKRERRNWLLPPLLLQEERRRLPRQAEEWRSIWVAQRTREINRRISPRGSVLTRWGKGESAGSLAGPIGLVFGLIISMDRTGWSLRKKSQWAACAWDQTEEYYNSFQKEKKILQFMFLREYCTAFKKKGLLQTAHDLVVILIRVYLGPLRSIFFYSVPLLSFFNIEHLYFTVVACLRNMRIWRKDFG